MTKINEKIKEIKEKLEKSTSLEEIKAKNLRYYQEKYKGYFLLKNSKK